MDINYMSMRGFFDCRSILTKTPLLDTEHCILDNDKTITKLILGCWTLATGLCVI